jgi:hypothetical protein
VRGVRQHHRIDLLMHPITRASDGTRACTALLWSDAICTAEPGEVHGTLVDALAPAAAAVPPIVKH